MSNKEFFSKRSNYFTDLLATLFYTIAGLLFFFISPSYSLSWNDEEWLTSGCPKTASGKWVIDSPKNKDLRFITINNNELTYIFKSNKEHKFAIENYSLISKNKFLKLKIKPINSQKETVLKIRPHLIHTNFKKEINHPNCLIKVFDYKNERHAKTERYSGWNIFRLLK
jgi:hypothetical protein